MGLIFGGDFVWPEKGCLDLSDPLEVLAGEQLVLNFEGPMLKASPNLHKPKSNYKFNLHNCSDSIEVLHQLNVKALGLANNHINDYREGENSTLSSLNTANIPWFGLNDSPFIDIEADGHIWRVVATSTYITDCGSAAHVFSPVSFEPAHLLKKIKQWKHDHPTYKIAVFVHWGYELFRYPLPADREWARDAITAGASCVIGHHPHVVQGIERFKGGVIAYSLGNFVMPQVEYRDRKLVYFDELVLKQALLRLGEVPTIYWFFYDKGLNKIVFQGEENIASSQKVKDLTPFDGLSDKEYVDWYIENVKEKHSLVRGTPIFKSYKGVGRFMTYFYKFLIFNKKCVRKLLMSTGIHTPYNWR